MEKKEDENKVKTTTEKKKYEKPRMTIIKVEPQRLLSASIIEHNLNNVTQEEHNGEFW